VVQRLLKVIVALCVCGAPAFAQAASVKDVRLWRAPDHTRVVFDLSAPATHKLMVLSNPRRIVLDVANTALKSNLDDLQLAGTPVQRVRSGVREGNDLRVVFEIGAEVDPRSFSLAANAQAGDRLVLDLYDKRVGSEAVSVRKSASQSAKRDIVIAIDAGHGGEDPGAIGPRRLREKDVVLAIANDLKALLEADAGFKPTLIRTGDYYISLKGRRELARERQADLFVSIHADAFPKKQANGASVYALSTSGATSTAARLLAQRENAADLVGGVKLSDKDDVLAGVLADLSMTSTLDTSISLGDRVLGNIDSVARLHKKNVEQAGFAVLKSPDIPSILVETGFISNPDEARRLSQAEHQDKIARAITRGVEQFMRSNPPPGTLLAATGGELRYTIVRGDTLSRIAQRYGVSSKTLRTHNGLANDKIRVGQVLLIPNAG